MPSPLASLLIDLQRVAASPRLSSDNMLLESFCLLVGAALSLSRAAAHRPGPREPARVLANSIAILDTLIRDGDVRAPLDRAAEEWSAGYYLSNATHRLNAAASKLGAGGLEAPTLRTDQAFQPKWDAEVERMQTLAARLGEIIR